MSKIEYNKKYRQDNKGTLKYWLTQTYGRMKRDNKLKFNSDLPFSKEEFLLWVNKTDILEMLEKYKQSNFKKDLHPSIDRIDDYVGYNFDNIQLVTWKENNEKGRKCLKNKLQCSEMAKNKWSKKLVQKDLNGTILRFFNSTHDVTRKLGYDSSLIARACRENKISKGYRWQYV